MSSGLEVDEIIRIGFLNVKVDELLEDYQAEFDILIVNDGSFEVVNALVAHIADHRNPLPSGWT